VGYILVVDDDSSVVKFLERGLSLEGYEVSTCASGDAALIQITKRMPDLLILDWMMPGLPGDQVLLRLRERQYRLPVIILSARDTIFDQQRILKSGANLFLNKPVDFTTLLAHVRIFITESGIQ
jgi:DNA-binding response OmpR family regulator